MPSKTQTLFRLLFLIPCFVVPWGSLSAQSIDLLAEPGLGQFVDADGKPVSRTGWTNQDGVLRHTRGGGNIFYREPVRDFILEFEFNIPPRGNNGIKYRVAKYGNSWLGCEFQVQDDRNKPLTKQATGSLYAVYEPASQKKQNPPGRWNHGKIVVRGNQIQHWLNGILIVDATAGSVDWNRRVEASKFKPHKGFGQNRDGRIMVTDHNTEVSYRNMKLTRLIESSSMISDSGKGSMDHPFNEIVSHSAWGDGPFLVQDSTCLQPPQPCCQTCPRRQRIWRRCPARFRRR